MRIRNPIPLIVIAALLGAGITASLFLLIPYLSGHHAKKGSWSNPVVYSSFFTPLASVSSTDKKGIFSIGEKLGVYVPYFHKEKGNLERGVVSYGATDNSNIAVALVRTLDIKRDNVNDQAAGFKMLQEMDHLKSVPVPGGALKAAIDGQTRAIVEVDKNTIVEVKLLSNPQGTLPEGAALAQLVAPLA
jgi:hypothetical protein